MVLSRQHFGKGEAMETVQESGVARASGRGEMDEQEEHRVFWGQWNYVVDCCDGRYVPLSIWHIPGGSVVKNLPANAGDAKMQVWSLGQEDTLEKKMATHSSILAWKIPWTEESGGLWSVVCGIAKSRTRLSAHIHIQFSKPRESPIPRVTLNMSCALWKIMMGQCRPICCHRCIECHLVGMLIMGNVAAIEKRVQYMRDPWTLPSKLLGTSNCPKNKVLNKKKNPSN